VARPDQSRGSTSVRRSVARCGARRPLLGAELDRLVGVLPLQGQPPLVAGDICDDERQDPARTEFLNLQGLAQLWAKEERRYQDDIEEYRNRQERGVVLALVGLIGLLIVAGLLVQVVGP
jgi:hypothetical protein